MVRVVLELVRVVVVELEHRFRGEKLGLGCWRDLRMGLQELVLGAGVDSSAVAAADVVVVVVQIHRADQRDQ